MSVLASETFFSLIPTSDYFDRTGIAGQFVVRGQQSDVFDLCLRYKYAVEGIFVNQWKKTDGECVFGPNSKFAVPMLYQAVSKLPRLNLKVFPV